MLRFTANLSLLFTEVPLQQRFQAAKDQGFEAVEIQFPYELSADVIRQELDKQQLKLVLFNVDADDLLQGGEGLAAAP
ncbi:hydroxypyruvate isomerase, partial [Methylococcaceae bacterium HT4]